MYQTSPRVKYPGRFGRQVTGMIPSTVVSGVIVPCITPSFIFMCFDVVQISLGVAPSTKISEERSNLLLVKI